MTVLVGILCEDGAVIGSDSSATFTAGHPEHKTIEQQPVKKTFTIGESLLFAGSGPVGLGQRFGEVLLRLKVDKSLAARQLMRPSK